MTRPGLVVGITGATGAIYGVKLLEHLRELDIPSHLIVSTWGKRTIEHETKYSMTDVYDLATTVEGFNNLAASISSGSFRTAGMIVAPCSVKTLAAISVGLADNLITRAADVVLKERRRLVLMVRETPLSEIHLENMLRVARMGVTVMPPVPSFYNHPETIDEMVEYTVARTLDQLQIPARWADPDRWDGTQMGRRSGEQG
jgi:flavin prenyltransferase